jgi:hypothetical protein
VPKNSPLDEGHGAAGHVDDFGEKTHVFALKRANFFDFLPFLLRAPRGSPIFICPVQISVTTGRWVRLGTARENWHTFGNHFFAQKNRICSVSARKTGFPKILTDFFCKDRGYHCPGAPILKFVQFRTLLFHTDHPHLFRAPN